MIKIGLVAPFEGRYRVIGYEAIYAARLAIREINARGGVNGYRIELVALDDRGEDDRALTAARQLIIDPQVVVVIGHYRPMTTDAVLSDYCAAGLPLMAFQSTWPVGVCPFGLNEFRFGRSVARNWPDDRLTFVSNVPDPNSLPSTADFVAQYNAIPIDGTRAGPIALQTYDVMFLVFDAVQRAEKIERGGVALALANSQFTGSGSKYAFDQAGNLIEGRTYVYEYDSAGRPQLITP
ncbi:MAG: amino acid ABC transporter substrate-binding protein [Chloroflexi bacterium]|nr:amino acid ABC transporter substrate-binding protein [Chloroflexota bacterium]